MAARARPLVGAVALTTTSSLLVTVLACRALALPAPLAHALLPRSMAIPFAAEACTRLGISFSIALLANFCTGIMFPRSGSNREQR
jgi:putative effector of murein hydrolase